jgi:hypothetical protein
MVRPGCQEVDHSSRRVIWAQPTAGPVMTHRSGSAAANRVACRSQDAASSGQVTSSTIRPSPSHRRAKAAAVAAASAERPRPMAMVMAPRRRASSAMRFSSAPVASFPGLAAGRTTSAGSRGDSVISAPHR